MKLVIPCAGKSTRMNLHLPKVLLKVNSKSLIQYIMDFWTPYVEDIICIVGYRAEAVIEKLPSNVAHITQNPIRGVADAILQAENFVGNSRFIVALGDCIHVGTFEFDQLLNTPSMGIGVWKDWSYSEMIKNYSVELDSNNYVSNVQEKPYKVSSSSLCGMGTYLLDARVFYYIRNTPLSARGEIEITDVLELMLQNRVAIAPLYFNGHYVNVTYPEDLKTLEVIS